MSEIDQYEMVPTHEFDASTYSKHRCTMCGLHADTKRGGTGLFIHPTTDDSFQITSPDTEDVTGETVVFEHFSGDSPSSNEVFDGAAELPPAEPDYNFGVVVKPEDGEPEVITVRVPGRYAAQIEPPPDEGLWTMDHIAAEMGRIADEQLGLLVDLQSRVGDAVLHREYQQKVAQAAIEFAIKYDWCEEVLTCLDRVGIAVKPLKMHLTWTVTHGLDIEVPYERLRDYFRDTHGYVETLLMDVDFVPEGLATELELLARIKLAGTTSQLADSVMLPVELDD